MSLYLIKGNAANEPTNTPTPIVLFLLRALSLTPEIYGFIPWRPANGR